MAQEWTPYDEQVKFEALSRTEKTIVEVKREGYLECLRRVEAVLRQADVVVETQRLEERVEGGGSEVAHVINLLAWELKRFRAQEGVRTT